MRLHVAHHTATARGKEYHYYACIDGRTEKLRKAPSESLRHRESVPVCPPRISGNFEGRAATRVFRPSEQAREALYTLPDLLRRHRAERQPHEPVARHGAAVVRVGEERGPRGENQPPLLRPARQ